MARLKRLSLVARACGLVLASAAQAGPPFVTDDPEPPPPGGWEINVPFILVRTPGETEMNAPLFDLNYGLPNVQLKLEGPVGVVHNDHGGAAADPGDLLPGIKWRFFQNEQAQLQAGLYPQVLVPTGDRRHGLGAGQPAYVLPLLVQKGWSNWTLYGNVGYWWQTAADQQNFWYAGAVLEREVNERLTLGVEWFGNTPPERAGRPDVVFNVGGAWKLSPHANLLFSAGHGVVGDARAIVYLGLQVLTKGAERSAEPP